VEEEEEEDQERAKGEEEPPDGGERGSGERTVDTRGPVAPEQWREGCGPAEELGRRGLPEFARDSPAGLLKCKNLAQVGERRPGREKEMNGVAASVPLHGHL
jgi:hypothetical protein